MARPCFVDVWAQAEQIDGWYGKEEAALLYALLKGPWCEIGVWKGRSTTILAQSGLSGVAIDWFRGSPESPGADTYLEAAKNLPYPNVTLVRERFEDAHSLVGEIQLLHLDAEHSYEATKMAFDLYAPKVVEEGFVFIHDAVGRAWPEVERFAEELKFSGWLHVADSRLTAVFQR